MMDHCEHVTRAHGMSEGQLARRYVAYYRVSTIQQGQFGFSIEAQRAAVQDYVSANPDSVVAEPARSPECTQAHAGLTRL
jgi:hypothetical protein